MEHTGIQVMGIAVITEIQSEYIKTCSVKPGTV